MSKTIRNLNHVSSSAGITSPKFRNFAKGNTAALDAISEFGCPLSNRLKRQANIIRNGIGHPNEDKAISGFAQMDWNRPFIVSFGFMGDAFGANQIEVLAKDENSAEKLATRVLLECVSGDFAIDEVYLKSN